MVRIHKNSRGFTLMELLVALGIVGLLTTTAAVSLGVTRAKARNVKRRVEAKVIVNAVLAYQADHAEALPPGMDGTSRMIGTSTTSCNISCSLGDPVVEELELYPSADTYLYQYAPAQNFGTETQLQEYPWNIGYSKRGLVRFNLSSISPDSTIISAVLSMKEAATYGQARTIALHRLTRDWIETSASWNRYNAFNAWTAGGGDFASTPSATALVVWYPSAILDWNTWDVTQDVQQFVTGASDNYGWLIKDNSEDTSQQYWYFSSRESADKPKLTVRYSSNTVGDGVAESCLNLAPIMVPDYLNKQPVDPRYGSAARTYYVVRQSINNEIFVRACGAELGETIIQQGS